LDWRQQADDLNDGDMPMEFAEWLAAVDCFSWLDADMQVLRDMLGDRFTDESETVTVNKEKLVQLQLMIAELFPSAEGTRIIEELRRLSCKPMRDLLSIYPHYVQRLADKLGKSVYPLSVEGGEFVVDHERYLPLVRSLSHVFSNMVDHGIETPETRASFGKTRFGTISCRIDATDGNIAIAIANDGSVIDTADIRRIALDKGLATAAEFDAASREEQLLFIFHDSFSTRRRVSPISGRGFGLSAVKHAVEALHGEVSVASDTVQGTVFRFTVPHM
jgi:two-component system chemotaxis sensor kinase CheA